ncbi:MAG TPA: L-threonylcarbamoyladenylate synthase [Methanocorpusculum sp.]|nr:L-threonylcarbamoyladenylate synthase [Methanocorpusculum sp.]
MDSSIKVSEENRIEYAVKVLSRDGLVVYPTETVYGLGADALSENAVYKVYEAKRRLMGKPISIAVSDIEMIYGVAHIDDFAERFINKFLPGPVTVVLPSKNILPEDLTGGTKTIGIRYPDNAIALELISKFDSPITSTSANISGEVSPITAEMVNVVHDYLIDGGKTAGIPSTVVDLENKNIIRAGAMVDEVASFIRKEIQESRE